MGGNGRIAQGHLKDTEQNAEGRRKGKDRQLLSHMRLADSLELI